jgi:serine/threonine protein kinase
LFLFSSDPLADFGVSEKLKSDVVMATDYVGSPLFMSPEVINKEGYNNKTDLWSLGMILFSFFLLIFPIAFSYFAGITMIEMCEGKPPYTDINSIDKLPQLALRPPAKFKNEMNYSEACRDFLACCLIKDVEKRPDAIGLLLVCGWLLFYRVVILVIVIFVLCMFLFLHLFLVFVEFRGLLSSTSGCRSAKLPARRS